MRMQSILELIPHFTCVDKHMYYIISLEAIGS